MSISFTEILKATFPISVPYRFAYYMFQGINCFCFLRRVKWVLSVIELNSKKNTRDSMKLLLLFIISHSDVSSSHKLLCRL